VEESLLCLRICGGAHRDVLLRLLSEDSNGDTEDFLPATASPPWQWQWPQAEESLLQPSWHWQHVHQPDAYIWPSMHSPLGPACSAQVSSAACATAMAAEEAKEASAAHPGVDVHRTALLEPASKVPEQSPGAQSDGSTSTTCVHHKLDRQSSRQSLDNTEEAPVKVALAQQSGQDLSDESQTTKVSSAPQKPLASTLASGLVGESSQASLESQASDAPPLEEQFDAIQEEISRTFIEVKFLEQRLAGYRRFGIAEDVIEKTAKQLLDKHISHSRLMVKMYELKIVSDSKLLLAGPIAEQLLAG